MPAETRRSPRGSWREYLQNEIAFTGRWQTAFHITLASSLELARYLPRLQMLEALKETVPYVRTVFVNEAIMAYLRGHEAGSRYTWSQASMEGDPPGCKFEELSDGGLEMDEEEADPSIEESLDVLESRLEEMDIAPGLLEKMEYKLAAEAWPIWVAYTRFCEEELGVEPHKLLAAVFEVYLEPVKGLERLAAELELEATEEQIDEYLSLFSECWSHKLSEP
jgi:hypothetical protein